MSVLRPSTRTATRHQVHPGHRKAGCLDRKGASPRGYTFLWELALAWRMGAVPRNNLQAVAVFCLCITAVHFLLRPRYVRSVDPTEIRHDGGTRYILRWKWEDKARPGRLTSTAASGAGAAAPPSADPPTTGPYRGIPAKHPRVSGASGSLLHSLQQMWRGARGDAPGPLFCRVEPASQTVEDPSGSEAG